MSDTSVEKSRYFGIDLLRALAIVFVVGGHFFSLHTRYMSSPMDNVSMLVQSVAQFLFSGGVPLFILMTGYLNGKKTISKKYYGGIWRVLIAYLFYSVLCICFRQVYLHEAFSVKSAVLAVTGYTSFMYGWYIEMWIGLFLMIPFLNAMYHGLQSKRHKEILILTFAFLTFAPILTNRYGLRLLPGYWEDCYPIAFYYIGMYIKQFQLRLQRKWLWALALLGICSLNGVSSMVLAFGDTPKQIFGHCFGLVGAVSAVITFLLCYDVQCERKWVVKPVYWVALLSLDMYLGCWMFDAMIYPWAMEHYFTTQSEFGVWFFVIVPAVCVGAFALALVKRMLFSLPPLRSYR